MAGHLARTPDSGDSAFRELLNARKGELAEVSTREHGEVLSDALGEVTRGESGPA